MGDEGIGDGKDGGACVMSGDDASERGVRGKGLGS